MRINYINIYEWQSFEDGTEEKFYGRLDALIHELSFRTKLGCPNIMLGYYYPFSEIEGYEEEKNKYQKIVRKLEQLIELIKSVVDSSAMINDNYLYELWVSRIFKINFQDKPIKEIEKLISELKKDNNINPSNICLRENPIYNPVNKNTFQKVLTRTLKKLL